MDRRGVGGLPRRLLINTPLLLLETPQENIWAPLDISS